MDAFEELGIHAIFGMVGRDFAFHVFSEIKWPHGILEGSKACAKRTVK
jgi:hypothetical protein